MKKNLNRHCPLQTECERTCKYEGHELDCDYYEVNARPDYEIEDQEERRREIERKREAEYWEEQIAGLPDEEAEAQEASTKGRLVYIPIGKLFPHPDNPRKDLGDLTELAASIKANGVFQNLTVVKRFGETTREWNGSYTIIIGHRRCAAAKLAGLTELPCVVAEMTPQEQLSTMLLENMQRSDLTVYEQAQSFQMLIDMGESVESVASKTGFSSGTVRRRLKMTELDQDVLKQVSSRPLSLGDFDKLAQIEDLAARNKCLEDIGTGNFNQSIEKELKKQAIRKALLDVKACIKSLGARKITQSEMWSNKYDAIGQRIYLHNWQQDQALLPKNEKRKLFYHLNEDYGELRFFVEHQKAKPVKRLQAEIDREKAIAKAWAQVDEFNALAYKLRSDFIKGISLNSKNITLILKGAVSASILRCVDYVSGDRDLFCSTLGLDDKGCDPQRAAKAMTAFNDLSAKGYPMLVYANFGDGKNVGYTNSYKSRWPEYEKNARLDALYDWLISLGYEMSDEEKSMRDGTHEVFAAQGESDAPGA